MKLKIGIYNGGRDKEIISLLSNDSFMAGSDKPAESVIASVLDYQKKTSNFNQPYATILLNSNEEIVGYLGHLAFQVLWLDKKMLALQTSSAFIEKNYPGNFGSLLQNFVEKNKDLPLFSILPTPKIHKSFERLGFVEVNKGRFSFNNYIITSYSGFLTETLKLGALEKAFSIFNGVIAFFLAKKTKFYSELIPCILDNFDNDYSLIEGDYKKQYSNQLVSVWNKKVLKNKFENKIHKCAKPLKENEAFHIIVKDDCDRVVGSLILKKVRGLNRLIISDIQTIKSRRVEIVNCLVKFSLGICRKYKFNALMFFGLEETYVKILRKNFRCFSRRVDMKAYFKGNGAIPNPRVNLVYSDDDVNF